MRKIQCNICGSQNYKEHKIDYLYRHKGKYLLIPNTSVEICSDCGMTYYDAKMLKQIEKSFFAIYNQKEQADNYISIPIKTF